MLASFFLIDRRDALPYKNGRTVIVYEGVPNDHISITDGKYTIGSISLHDNKLIFGCDDIETGVWTEIVLADYTED